MKIIFSPAKDMDFSSESGKNALISDKTAKILEVMSSMNREEIKKALKISDKLSEEVYSYYRNFRDNNSYEAINLYNGLSYRQMDRNYTEEEREYMRKNVIILSAFYGPINPLEIIKPYRLDMLSSVKIDGRSLREFWRADYNEIGKTDETILNLASDEFSSLIDREKFNVVDFDFYRISDGELKKHSTTLKKSRGIMLDFLIKNSIESLEQLKECRIEKLEYSKDLSEENKLVYIMK